MIVSFRVCLAFVQWELSITENHHFFLVQSYLVLIWKAVWPWIIYLTIINYNCSHWWGRDDHYGITRSVRWDHIKDQPHRSVHKWYTPWLFSLGNLILISDHLPNKLWSSFLSVRILPILIPNNLHHKLLFWDKINK